MGGEYLRGNRSRHGSLFGSRRWSFLSNGGNDHESLVDIIGRISRAGSRKNSRKFSNTNQMFFNFSEFEINHEQDYIFPKKILEPLQKMDKIFDIMLSILNCKDGQFHISEQTNSPHEHKMTFKEESLQKNILSIKQLREKVE